VLIATVQVLADPLHAPLQAEKTYPEAGVAVSVTVVPLVNDWLHPVLPLAVQLIPAGLEVIVPLPPSATCSAKYWTAAAKLAPTLRLEEDKVTVQEAALPEQAPLQPEKVNPLAAAAFSVTVVPLTNVWLHPAELVQLMPAGLEVTLPVPLSVTCSVS
jgi:hypothetical protein